MSNSNGRKSRPVRSFASLRPSDQRTGTAEATHSAPTATIAADMTAWPRRWPPVSGADHCQPMVSWDQMASANTTKIVSAAADGDQAAPLAVVAVEGLTTQARRGGTRHDAAAGHVERPPERVGSLLHVGDEQLDELLAVARPPLLRIPAQEAHARCLRRADSSLLMPVPTCRRGGGAPHRRCGAGWPGGTAGPRHRRR